ncbi:flagellar biosynthetic protein FliR [Prosthecomicrobium sp. N25]|uniref:flagellar biosynthetic protein FliR n=1 Tax=Prosthecomicrobium sp. N25 TaxID=3129254 RepID=UPI003077204E
MNVSVLPDIAVFFMLMFGRMGSMMMLLPAIGESGIPARIRLAFAVLVVLVAYPVASPLYPAGLAGNPPRLILLLASEIAVGLFVGLAARIVMAAAQVAGTTIANQLGLGFAMAVDPTQGQQGVVVGNFVALLATTLVFAFDLHHLAIAGLTGSYRLFPPGQLMPVGDFAEAAVTMVGQSFKIGVQISAPFLAFGLVFQLGLGVLSKLMPAFQIFFVAMPLNIGMGFALLALVLGTIMLWYMEHVRDGLARFSTAALTAAGLPV